MSKIKEKIIKMQEKAEKKDIEFAKKHPLQYKIIAGVSLAFIVGWIVFLGYNIFSETLNVFEILLGITVICFGFWCLKEGYKIYSTRWKKAYSN